MSGSIRPAAHLVTRCPGRSWRSYYALADGTTSETFITKRQGHFVAMRLLGGGKITIHEFRAIEDQTREMIISNEKALVALLMCVVDPIPVPDIIMFSDLNITMPPELRLSAQLN